MSRAVAAGIALLYLAGAAATMVMTVSLRGASVEVPPPVVFTAFPLAGLMIVWGRGSHPVGWILLLAGPTVLVAIASQEYALFASVHRLPLHDVALVVSNTVWTVMLLLLAVLLPLLFPTGRLPSRRWLAVVGLWAVYTVLVLAGNAFVPGPLDGKDPRLTNPIGVAGHQQLFAALAELSLLPLAGWVLGVVAGVVARYRRSDAAERQQLKWFLFSATLIPVPLALNGVAPWDHISFLVVFPLLPTAIAVAILRYRLYDIDIFISRTLAYAALAALITAVYIAIVVGAGSLAGQAGRPNLLLSIVATAVVAVAFQPLRDRFQLLANRIVFGRRATPYEVLAKFAREVGAFSGDDALSRMARVLAEGTGAGRAEVWLDGRRAAVHGTEGGGEESRAEVWHQGERLGALRVVKRRGETLSPREEMLLADLAHQAGMVLRNVGLAQQLLRRLGELRTSRERLVRVQDDERRRLELELRDGAQHQLLEVKRGLASARLATVDRARARLPELEAGAEQALQTTRELARGLYPPLLQDRGLAVALAAQARRSSLPVTVEEEAAGRFPVEVEAAVYFCVMEALRNVEKHSGASFATVRLGRDGGVLSFEVEDDGTGFDQAGVAAASGLVNMRDRVEALDGAIEVVSVAGRGTRVSGRLPIAAAVPA